MPKQKYNKTDVTHIVHTAGNRTGGIVVADGMFFGIDHFYEESLDWWRDELDSGNARIATDDDFPQPQFPDGRLKKQFQQRDYVVFDGKKLKKADKDELSADAIAFQYDEENDEYIFVCRKKSDESGSLIEDARIAKHADKIKSKGRGNDKATKVSALRK